MNKKLIKIIRLNSNDFNKAFVYFFIGRAFKIFEAFTAQSLIHEI